MAGELLLLQSPCSCERAPRAQVGGSKNMGRRCKRYKNVFSASTGGMVRRCSDFSGGGLLGGLEGTSTLGATHSLKATFGDVKDVAITAGIGALGAIITDIIFDQLVKNIESLAGLTGYKRAAAEAITGIALGIVVGKVMKRPRLGAKLATGPVVLAVLRVAGELLNAGPYAADRGLADVGMMAIEPYRPELAIGGEDLGAMQVGPGTPSWMLNPQQQSSGAVAGSLAS